jgi:hypothetical protein
MCLSGLPASGIGPRFHVEGCQSTEPFRFHGFGAGSCPQDLRSARRSKIRTFADIAKLTEAEHERVKARAALGEDVAPQGRRQRRSAVLTDPLIEVFGGDQYAGKKSAAEAIDLDYIQWGFSQKPQLAGARCLIFRRIQFVMNLGHS